jgi:hypothetical protein
MRIGYWWGSQKKRRPLARPRRRWMNNIKTDLIEIGWDGVEWVNLAQNMELLGGSCEHGDEPLGSINADKFLSGCTIGGFSRRAQFRK